MKNITLIANDTFFDMNADFFDFCNSSGPFD